MNHFKGIVSFLPSDLVEYVLSEYDKNDPAHLRQHAIDVVCHADEIIRTYPDKLEDHRTAIIVAALLHDVACHVNRDLHHILGALAVEDILIDYGIRVVAEAQYECSDAADGEVITCLTRYDVRRIKFAILEHRASWKHKRHDVVSDVVAAADRGKLNILNDMRRAVLYRTAPVNDTRLLSLDSTKIKIIDESIVFMKDKYGDGGYAYTTLPNHTLLMYANELANIKDMLDGPATELRRQVFDKYDEWVGVCRE